RRGPVQLRQVRWNRNPVVPPQGRRSVVMSKIPSLKDLPFRSTGAAVQTPETWSKAAQRVAGRPASELGWKTAEGIDVKALYTAADRAGIEHLGTFPGFPPYVRGPYASMYVARPWTVRQY